jgi:hypothetical protein
MCVGADDPIVPLAQRVAFEEEMRSAAVDWQMIVYGGRSTASPMRVPPMQKRSSSTGSPRTGRGKRCSISWARSSG